MPAPDPVPPAGPAALPPRPSGRQAPAGRLSAERRPPAVLVVPALVAAVFALLPLGYLAVRSLERGPAFAWQVVANERTAELLGRSLGLAAVVVTASLLLGISLAWLTVRTALPAAGAWSVLVTLPLAVPSYVAAFAWLSAFPDLAGFTGSALALTLVSFPYVYLPVTASLRGADPAQEEVSRSLGTGALRTFWRVTLPQVRPAAAGGAVLVALYVLSDFGAVSLMRYDTFTRGIYTSYRASFDRTPAAALSVVLVVMTVALVAAEARTRGRAGHARTGTGTARPAVAAPLGRWRVPALAWCAAVTAVAVVTPLATLGYWLAVGNSATWDPARLLETAGTTLGVAAAGALLTTLLALPVGVIAARHRGRAAHLLEQSAYAGHALPGITVALSLVFFAVRYAEPLYQDYPLLVCAYAVLFLPVAVAGTRAAVLQSPPVLEDVARSLGRSPLRVLREVTVPLAAPGVAAGAALTFVVCMKELPATLLLRPTGMDTLATRLWTETGTGSFAAAAPYAAALILLAAVPSYLLGRHRT
ncbi:iron ABC transporter permease [Streptomyces agglomeratus]|uniref:ABC transporter permease n=1 Tax=Streptomyces agglomeratus TaxID=285458 RepID=UPI0008542D9A|nr:iron ABC transporter permease [Streptomyces agglomeratus]OEJ37816.1 iron ABC transporter permease [Streptomyces agglomeratus]OEJ47800.1 iron ABC transporter permease [Streptomyces agglomeratus]OEJ50352.1 iron ABC transporter permease [Streptomyces agglomeratus]OEJ57679.1 iron ABC transporter permease [Streptomyces agglomeratus]